MLLIFFRCYLVFTFYVAYLIDNKKRWGGAPPGGWWGGAPPGGWWGGAPPGGWWGGAPPGVLVGVVLLLVCWWGWCSSWWLVGVVLLLVCWWAASYCQRIPGRRARGSRFRAAGVSRLNEGSRVFPEIGISLIINYLSSPLGR